MASALRIPPGTVLARVKEDGDVRIRFVEEVDGFVLRFVIDGTDEEFLIDEADGVRVRPTVIWIYDEFAAGGLRDLSAGEATLTAWGGRYLGLDRAVLVARQPRAVLKYDLALAALRNDIPRSAKALEEFAAKLMPDAKETFCGRSIIRWMNNLELFDGQIGAMRNRSGRERGRSQLPPIADRVVHQAMALYHAVPGIKKMDAYALATDVWTQLASQGVDGLGAAAPSKTAVVNRINACENKDTWESKLGAHDANKHFLASGESERGARPFELTFMDGTEFEQVTLFSRDVPVPSSKMKLIAMMDTAALFVYPSLPFSGPYRGEMGMGALLSALTPPVLDDKTRREHPERVMFFGSLGRLRVDNDKAIIPPSSVANLASLIRRVELAKKFGPDEKYAVENYFGWLKGRLDGEPGTVLSPRSRRRSIRRDPLAEATMTRDSFAHRVEALRLEWNDTGHTALGGRTPNEIMLEHVAVHRTRFTPAGEVRRHLARTVKGTLTTDGVVFDNIRYRWNRTGVTKLLSENLAQQAFAKRLEGTARCEVWLRAYDWNVDFVDVLNESDNSFVTLWSDDPDYTAFQTRWEHHFHQSCVVTGATGAQTVEQRALRRAESIRQQWEVLENEPFGAAKKAAAVLELAGVRERGKNLAEDPDLSDFSHFLAPTDVAGRDRADIPKGPAQTNANKTSADGAEAAPADDRGGLDPEPRSVLQMLEQDQAEEDLDGGIEWDAEERGPDPDSTRGEEA